MNDMNEGDVMECDRCGKDVEADIERCLEDGGPEECSHCGLGLPDPGPEWRLENGWDEPEED